MFYTIFFNAEKIWWWQKVELLMKFHGRDMIFRDTSNMDMLRPIRVSRFGGFLVKGGPLVELCFGVIGQSASHHVFGQIGSLWHLGQKHGKGRSFCHFCPKISYFWPKSPHLMFIVSNSFNFPFLMKKLKNTCLFSKFDSKFRILSTNKKKSDIIWSIEWLCKFLTQIFIIFSLFFFKKK